MSMGFQGIFYYEGKYINCEKYLCDRIHEVSFFKKKEREFLVNFEF